MANVSEELMERTWRRLGASSGRDISRIQKKHVKLQKPLSTFVYKQLFELSESAAGVGIFAYHAVLEAFLSSCPKLDRVHRPVIERISAEVPARIQWEMIAAETPEPHASRYVCDALSESEEDDVALTEDEQQHCLRVLHIAILCLHKAGNRGANSA